MNTENQKEQPMTMEEKAERLHAAAKRLANFRYDSKGFVRGREGQEYALVFDGHKIGEAYLALEPVVEELVEALKTIYQLKPKDHETPLHLIEVYRKIAESTLANVKALLGKDQAP
jgi:hypothetical protein